MKKKDHSFDFNIGNIFKTFGDLLEVVQQLDARGTGESKKTGEFSTARGLKGAYGFSVRVGGLGSPTIQSFGNFRAGEGKSGFDESWEPILDVFDEGDRILVVTELPGVDEGQLHLELADNTLFIKADGVRYYQKQVELPEPVDENNIVSAFKNGIVEITLYKVDRGHTVSGYSRNVPNNDGQ